MLRIRLRLVGQREASWMVWSLQGAG